MLNNKSQNVHYNNIIKHYKNIIFDSIVNHIYYFPLLILILAFLFKNFIQLIFDIHLISVLTIIYYFHKESPLINNITDHYFLIKEILAFI